MADIRPLGPAWEHPLSRERALALVEAEPALVAELPRPARAPRGCGLYALTSAARPVPACGEGEVRLEESVCALGAFDGVHLGHRALVAAAVAEARELGVPAVAVTFDPDPSVVLSGPRPGDELLCVADRLRLLASLGVDALLVVPFTSELAAHDHASFLSGWLRACVGAVSLHVGRDFRMGRGGAGTVSALSEAARPLGMGVHGHELVEVDGSPVSATRIRGLVRGGEVEAAARLLARPHAVRGRVVHGRGEGTGFGFPTANVTLGPEACLPGEGVYAAFAISGGHAWPAAVNVGAPRTFGGEEGAAFLEATLLGFDGDLYGDELSVCFVAWLREPRKFASFDELKATVLGNVEWVRRFVGEGRVGA